MGWILNGFIKTINNKFPPSIVFFFFFIFPAERPPCCKCFFRLRAELILLSHSAQMVSVSKVLLRYLLQPFFFLLVFCFNCRVIHPPPVVAVGPPRAEKSNHLLLGCTPSLFIFLFLIIQKTSSPFEQYVSMMASGQQQYCALHF